MNTRNERHATQQKIMISAKKLFINQGFNKTSIRAIVQDAQVTTGSLYHFFSNKEVILQAIIDEFLAVMFEYATLKNEASGSKEYMPFFYEMAIFVRLISRYENLRDLLFNADDLLSISKLVVTSRTQLLEQWFGSINPTFKQRDFYNRALLIKGMLRAILLFKMSHPHDELDEQLHLLTLSAAHMFNLPSPLIEEMHRDIALLCDEDIPVLSEFSEHSE